MTRLVRTTIALSACVLLGTSIANAQATRTWVSGVGDDANPCSRTAPCKTFAGAISKTASGGEISALDPGGFGAVTITKPITINGDGTLAAILASLTNGIIINAPAGAVVTLRNISINGAGNGINGIRMISGSRLTVDKVDIQGFTQNGIDIAPNANAQVTVNNSYIRSALRGIRVAPTAGRTDLSVENTLISGMTNGLEATSGLITLSRVNINTNSTGILNNGGAINIENSRLVGNGTGVATNGGVSRLTNNAVVDNTTAFTCGGGGALASSGDNRISGSGAGCAPGSVVPVQ